MDYVPRGLSVPVWGIRTTTRMSGFMVCDKTLGDVVWSRIYPNPFNDDTELGQDSVLFNLK